MGEPIKKEFYNGLRPNGKRTHAARYTQGEAVMTIDCDLATDLLNVVSAFDKSTIIVRIAQVISLVALAVSVVLLWWKVWYAPIVGGAVFWFLNQYIRSVVAEIVFTNAIKSKQVTDIFIDKGIIAPVMSPEDIRQAAREVMERHK